MEAAARWQFLAELPQRLAAAVGRDELLAATEPPDGVVRALEPGWVRIDGRLLPSTVPRVVIQFRPAAEPAVPVVSPGPRWRVDVGVDAGSRVQRLEIAPASLPVGVVDRQHADARSLLGAMAAFYPAWRGGWELPPGADFVVVYEGGRPLAGAGFGDDGRGTAHASCLCVDPDRVVGVGGSILLDALEALALDHGCVRLSVDGSVFLHREHIPYVRHGYVVAPPYDGDADASVWAERELRGLA